MRYPPQHGLLLDELSSGLRALHAAYKSDHAEMCRRMQVELAPLPGRWQRRIVSDTISRLLAARSDAAERAAWIEYEALLSRIGAGPLPLDADDDDVRAQAERNAGHAFKILSASADLITVGAFPWHAAKWMQSQGVMPPAGKRATAMAERAQCPLWWRRAIRRGQARAVEGAAIGLGFVHKRADVYLSDESLRRRGQQNQRNAAALESTEATNEYGQTFTLAELAQRGNANKEIRRGELVTRIKGFEAWAIEKGDSCTFATLTCPSRFHSHLYTGAANPRHDRRLTPRDGQMYLRRIWAQIRARLARVGVVVYGFRIAEPHGDGCPHWHLLLWHNKESGCEVRATLYRYALLDSPDEPGAAEHRCKFVPIDRAKGSALSYVIKYVAKNIDGFRTGDWRIDGDLLGDETLNLAPRVEAWAATWNIRQFQQIGGPPVGTWREMRRVRELDPEGVTDRFLSSWFACQKMVDAKVHTPEGEPLAVAQASWLEFVRACGGIMRRALYPLRLVRDVAVRCSRYGEPVRRVALGLLDRAVPIFQDFGGIVGRLAVGSVDRCIRSVRPVWTMQRKGAGNAAMGARLGASDGGGVRRGAAVDRARWGAPNAGLAGA